MKEEYFWTFFTLALVVGLVFGLTFGSSITGKTSIIDVTNGKQQEQSFVANTEEESFTSTSVTPKTNVETEYISIQKISSKEAHERFKENMPVSLKQKIEEMGLDSTYPPYPIGCIDYEDMDGDWEVFKDQYGYWRARYLGPFPTKIKPYYVLDLDGVGSPVELWPENLQNPVQFWVDGCTVNINHGPTCNLNEAYCLNNNQGPPHYAKIYCTGNCTGDYTNGFKGCYGGLTLGKCNYPWRNDFGTLINPLIS